MCNRKKMGNCYDLTLIENYVQYLCNHIEEGLQTLFKIVFYGIHCFRYTLTKHGQPPEVCSGDAYLI